MHHPFASAHDMLAALQAKKHVGPGTADIASGTHLTFQQKSYSSMRNRSANMQRRQIQPLPGVAICSNAGLPVLDEPALETIADACYQAVMP